MLKFSIIIPTYNAEKTILRSLESCLDQGYSQVQIICVDDASTDNTINILQEAKNKDSRIKIINLEKNQGPLIARLEGMKIVQGDYVLFLDADDIFLPKSFYILAKHLKNKDIDILKFGYTKNKTGKKIFSKKIINKKDRIKAYLSLKNRLSPEFWAKAYRNELIKKLLLKANPFPAYISEDVYLSVLTTSLSNKDKFINKTLIQYNTETGVTSTTTKDLQKIEKYLSSYKNVIDNLFIFLQAYNKSLLGSISIFEQACIHDFINNRININNFSIKEMNELTTTVKKYFSERSLLNYFLYLIKENKFYAYWFRKSTNFLEKTKRIIKYILFLFKREKK